MRPRSKTISEDASSIHATKASINESSDSDSTHYSSDQEVGEVSVENNDDSLWTINESKQLIDEISKQLPQNDKFAYYHRITKLDWTKINIKNKSSEECKQHLGQLIKRTRHVRLLSELLAESIDAYYDNRKKHVTAYQLFCSDFRKSFAFDTNSSKKFFSEVSKKYHLLSDAELTIYKDKADSINQKRSGEMRKRSGLNSKELKTPFSCFYDDAVQNGAKKKNLLKTQYKNLDFNEKLKWVKIAIEKFGDEVVLYKEDKSILAGKLKRPLTAYNLFMRDYSATNKAGNFKEINEKFNKLNASKRDVYEKKAAELKMEYNRQLAKHKLQTIEQELLTMKADQSLNDDVTDFNLPSTSKRKNSLDSSINWTVSIPQNDASFSQVVASSTVIDANVLKIEKEKKTPRKKVPTPTSSPEKTPKKRTISNESAASLSAKKIKRDKSPIAIEMQQRKFKKERNSASESFSEDSSAKTNKNNSNVANNSKIEAPVKPPTNSYKYYKKFEYKGKPKKAKKSFENLSIEDKKRIKRLHKKLVAEYMDSLQEYLSTLSKKEVVAYSQTTHNTTSDSE